MSGLLIVDDDVGFRSLVHALLAAGGFSVAGEAADGEGALQAVERLRPDVVLLDVQLPDLDGFEVARRIASRAGTHGPLVVLISSRSASSYRSRLASSPARGFITKSELTGASLSALIG
ncbi:response regulator [Pedococcus sp. KACC 23699]|uniref:Response regulator n=1 Tax=Pedococcus sp. KACC 23699 TaxID=3149228 RepID=A0AAU7JUF6_9MICO